MASVNKVILIGNLGRDPETRYTTGGDAITNLNIATSEQWKDKSGEKQEKTEWHRVVLFGRQAEIAGEYLKKGRSVYIEGRLQTRKYTDKDGVEKYSTEIVGDRMQLLGSREGSGRRRRRFRRRKQLAPERRRRLAFERRGRPVAAQRAAARPSAPIPTTSTTTSRSSPFEGPGVGSRWGFRACTMRRKPQRDPRSHSDPTWTRHRLPECAQSADATSFDARASARDGTAITPPPRHTSPS